MGETADSGKDDHSTKSEKEKHEKKEKSKHEDEDEKGEKSEEKAQDKKKKDKEGKEKKTKNPEDKKDQAKLKLKLEKLDAKMQALAIKKEEIMKLIKEAEKAAANPNEGSAAPPPSA